jgi:hypothetical protein
MLSQFIRVALSCAMVVVCISFDYAETNAQAENPVSSDTVILCATTTLYSQPPSPSGGLLQSSWLTPDGSDYDQYVWDGFTLPSNQAINKIQWRGGYDPGKFGSGGLVIDFTVAIYASIPGGTQPDIVAPPLVQYQTGGNAGETPAGTFGGASMYDYTFTLPKPFQAVAGTKYWVQIEASQTGIPDWGITLGTGGDGQYFRCMAGVGDKIYQIVAGDAAFTLLSLKPSLTVTSNGTYDGWVLELSEASNIGGSFNFSGTTFRLGDDAANRQYRAILSFNTGNLPDTAVIQSAVLKIKQSGVPTGSDPFTILGNLLVDIRKGAFGGVAALAATDFEAAGSAANVANFNKTPPVGGWYRAALNLTGRNKINRTGITQFRLRFDLPTDSNNTADFMKFVSGNAAADKPVLVVTYTVP